MTTERIRLLTGPEHEAHSALRVVRLANHEDPILLKDTIDCIDRIELEFPQFTDGRAYSQAYLLRRRLGFKGDLRATGDVLVDQLLQMERTGFSSAVLHEGLDPADARKQLDLFPAFYQRDLAQCV
jgi:uncharacterized protein (DUF934 family)